MKQDEDVRAFKNELKNYRYYQEKLKRRRDKLESLFNQLPGSVHGNDPSKEPVHSAPNKDYEYQVRDDIEVEEGKIKALEQRLKDIEQTLDKIPNEARGAVVSVCVEGKSYYSISRITYLSETGLKKMVNRTIKKALDD